MGTLAFPLQASPIDFLTLSQAKTWIEGLNPNATSPDDDVLQFLVTSVSQDMLTRMSRTTIYNTDYQEWYDGTGSATLPIDNWPINQVNLVQINGVVVPVSPDHLQPGYIVSRDKKFIQLVGGNQGFLPGYGVSAYWGGNSVSGTYNRHRGPSFYEGIGNIYVDYYGGYTAVPYDLGEACALIIDQDYRRRGWPDEAQINIPQGGGVTTYRAWEIPPRAWEIIWRYTRTARF